MNPWIRRLYSLMLFAYPRDFREEYRASMNDHLEREQPGWGGALRTAVDALSTAAVMRTENLWRDLTYAVRMNAKAPLFTVVIVAAIALAIATNTVVFALLDAVLLKPLPYANAQQIGVLWQQLEHGKTPVFHSLATPQVDAIARASRTIASVTAAMGQHGVSAAGIPVERTPVEANYFSTLGVQPLIGSFFTKNSSARDAVISYDLWRKRYREDARALGKRIALDGELYRIAGVAPPGMLDPLYGSLVQSDVWTLMPRPTGDRVFAVSAIVRLKNGVTWQAAQADLARIQRNVKGPGAAFPGSEYITGPLDQAIFAGARAFLWMVFAAVTGVLLIACANVANLLLARASIRESEFAVRSAIGASARRIASQVLTEALLLALAGAAIGLGLAWAALPWAKALVPGNVPRVQTAHIDSTVLLYVCGLLVAVTLLTGMIPAYRPRQNRGRDTAARVRSSLVVVEVAIAFALTAGFGLMLQSFVALTNVDIGFSPHGVYAASVAFDREVEFSPQIMPAHPQALRSMVRQIRAIPGVEDATVATSVPFQNAFAMTYLLPRGWNGNAHGTPSSPMAAVQVGESYFRILRVPVIAGNVFQSADYAAASGNIVVNAEFARAYFPHQSPIGKRIHYSSSAKDVWHIIGVVGNTRSSLKQIPQPLLYLPYNGGFGPFYGFVIRTSKQVPGLTRQISAIVRRAQVGPVTVSVTPLDDLVAKDASATRTSLDLLGALACVALLLGFCGIYSVVAYGTERRFHEIGIRMAVGARAGDIVALILANALLQCVLGVAVGVLLCAFTTRLLVSQLYHTSPLDARTLIGVAAILIVCTAVAALIPACRAAFARPAFTLRYE